MKKYISGDQLIKKYQTTPLDLLNLISETGLQPLSIEGTPLPPPDVELIQRIDMAICDMSDDFNPYKFRRLTMHPYLCFEEVEKQRGNLKTWRGFSFEDCAGGLKFDGIERRDILKMLSSDETFYLRDDVKKALKRSYDNHGSRVSATARHDQKSIKKFQKHAKKVWHEDNSDIRVKELVQKMIDEKIALKINGKPYKFTTVERWITGIKRGKH